MKSLIVFLLVGISAFAQQFKKVDFIKCDAFLSPIASTKSIFGSINYSFEVIKSIDTIKVDAVNMEFFQVQINGKSVNFKNSGNSLDLFEGFKKGKNVLTFNYASTPKQALYFIGEGDDLQIWTQGQGKYTSHWLPSFDDVNEKVIFNLSMAFNENFDFFLNGNFKKSILTETSKVKYFQMHKPMPSYLVMLAIGKFIKKTEITKSGTQLEYYLDRNDADKFEPTYRYSKQMFEFLEEEIGVKYPWGIYRQVPVRDFLYAGMENTTSTIFAQDFVVDSIGFNDKNYVNVNAHELAHQWFGDFVTAKESKHHWLQEGFATYYALLAEKELFGEDYFNYELFQMAEQLKEAAAHDKNPILSEKASSLTFYKKGAWALHVLRTNIGERKFRKAVKSYLKKYAYKNVDTDQFLAEIKKVSKYDVDKFKKEWLEDSNFRWNEAVVILNKSTFISDLVKIQELENIPFQEKKEKLISFMKRDAYFPIQQEILMQTKLVTVEEKQEIIDIAFKSNNVKVRQALAQSFTKIPESYKSQFESLLEDKSYITKEIALFKLWSNFKDDKAKYADLFKNENGLNYNLKIAYLTLQLVNNQVDETAKLIAVSELEKMANAPYESGVRQNAIETLLNFKLTSNEVLKSLLNASLHHKWRFVTYAKDKIRQLISTEGTRIQFIELSDTLNDLQKNRLNYFLNETR